jgi:hypothetical protein
MLPSLYSFFRRDPSNAAPLLLFWPAQFPQMPRRFSNFGWSYSLECRTTSLFLASAIPQMPPRFFSFSQRNRLIAAPLLFLWLVRLLDCRTAVYFSAGVIT